MKYVNRFLEGGKIKKTYFDESQLPFWSNPLEVTSGYIGYSTTGYSTSNSQIFFQGQSVSNIVLYCANRIDENGVIYNIDSSQLYMVKLKLSSDSYSKKEFEKFIDSFTGKYGKPNKKETSENMFSGAMMQIGRYVIKDGIDYTVYHRTYTWMGAKYTGIQIMADYNDNTKSYENITIYIGKTNMDSLLKAGKKIVKSVDSGTQLTVEKKRIALRDENKKTIQKLEVGTVLQITGYDKDLDMFSVIVLDGGSNAAYGSFDGYVYGDNLSISRAELLKQFKE